MTKTQQRRDWAIRLVWKKIYRLGNKLAQTQKAKDAVLRELMESVRKVQSMEEAKD